MSNRQLKTLIWFLVLSGYAWVSFSWHNETESHSFCAFKKVTGIPCPSCGTTRSIILLSHGEIIRAVQVNPLGLISGGFLLIAPFWLIIDFLQRKNSALLVYSWAENKIQSSTAVSVLLITLAAANWIWNMYKDL